MLHSTRRAGLIPHVAILILALVLPACGEATPGAQSAARRARVVCTVAMITDAARAIGGDRAEVVGLLGAGIDPHLYKPTRTDIEALMSADLVLYNGLHLEGKMREVLERAGASGRAVVPVAERLDETLLLVPPEGAGQHDPHVWMDPTAWGAVAGVVRDALSGIDPTYAEEFSQRAERYSAQLMELHAYAARVLGTIPEGRRVLVTAHDAFNYFGRRYGFEVVGIQGISTESEAGVRDIERIVSLLVERRIPAVFIESTVSERNIRALIEGARARGHAVTIGGSLFSDAMGEAGTYEGTYIGMIDHNVTAIARALGGDAPARGLHGRLAP